VLGDKKNFDVSRTLLMHKAAAFDITPKTPANVVITSSPIASALQSAMNLGTFGCRFRLYGIIQITVFR
jgi:hypothetical protein